MVELALQRPRRGRLETCVKLVSLLCLVHVGNGLVPLDAYGQIPVFQGSFYFPLTQVAADEKGNVYITGSFSDTVKFDDVALTSRGGTDTFVASYDSEGNLRWLQQSGGVRDDSNSGIGVDGSGGVYVAGMFSPPATFGRTIATNGLGSSLFLAKLPSNPAFAPPLRIVFTKEGSEILWNAANAVLELANVITGPWAAVNGASSPYPVPAGAMRSFYRLRE